jgi:ABC-type antimicrobial peptide transport system ATPase subunit
MHGFYDTRNEFSYDSYSNVKEIKIVQQDESTTVFKIALKKGALLFAVANNNTDMKAVHEVKLLAETIQWTGPYFYKKMNN